MEVSAFPLKSRRQDWSPRNLGLLFGLTIFAFAIMGYHPGLEDDSFYLAAIKRLLNPSLFPHDADFFRLQFQATIFDKAVAFLIRLLHLPIPWSVLFFQVSAIFFVLHGCFRIARRCFVEPAAQWGAVALVAILLSMPLPGVAINLADQYLHPRTIASGLILAAIVAVLDKHVRRAVALLVAAIAVHAIMAAFGISFCAFLFWNLNESSVQPRPIPIGAACLIPLGWLFQPASDAWRKAAATRSFYFVAHWQWYEWLGVVAPLALLYGFQLYSQKSEERRQIPEQNAPLRTLVISLLYFGGFQTVAGLAIMLPPGLERLRPFEPMRYLHLLYLLFFLILGGLVGRHLLMRRTFRWLAFVPLAAGMFFAQRQLFPSTPHIELPGAASHNTWLESFAWIRQSTPIDALFALDPHYLELPGEDYHGFRALAERSVLADVDKDAGMAARVPSLAPRWLREVNATAGWDHFQPADFNRLNRDFGVNWVVVSREQAASAELDCPYQNEKLSVCRLY